MILVFAKSRNGIERASTKQESSTYMAEDRKTQELQRRVHIPACYGLDKLNIRVVGSDGPEEGGVALSFIRRHRLSGTDLGRPANNSNTLHSYNTSPVPPIIDLIWCTLRDVPITRT